MYQIPEHPSTSSKGDVIIRWILVPISPFVGWGVSFIITLFVALFILEPVADFLMRFCPPEQVDEYFGTCTTLWYRSFEDLPFLLGASLMALSTVLLPAHLAPKFKFRVALVAFLAGVYAAFEINGGYNIVPLVGAILAGVLALLWVAKQLKRV